MTSTHIQALPTEPLSISTLFSYWFFACFCMLNLMNKELLLMHRKSRLSLRKVQLSFFSQKLRCLVVLSFFFFFNQKTMN